MRSNTWRKYAIGLSLETGLRRGVHGVEKVSNKDRSFVVYVVFLSTLSHGSLDLRKWCCFDVDSLLQPYVGGVCWLLSTSVLRKAWMLRTDVPRSQHSLSLCALGAKSKAGGERRNGSTPRASPVPTESVRTLESQTLTFMRLFGDGKHGQAERIQRFRGPACRTTFTARRHTPFYRLKPPSHQVAVVLTARACGLDPSEAPCIFGYRQATITSLSVACGLARANPARALLLPSPTPTPPVGRTAHQATQL